MTRRDFLKAVVGVGAVSTVPASMLPQWKRTEQTIGPATNPFWRNRQFEELDTARIVLVDRYDETLRREMRKVYNECSRGGNPPNAGYYG